SAVTGNALDNDLVGNGAANTITGNDGNDTLDGGGGNDRLIGGLGNDTYVVDSTGDVVTEAANAGTDTVESYVTYTLGATLENLVLLGSADINGTGNALANEITGNAGNNLLDGKAGADSMAGGAGNDVYVVDNLGDVVSESPAAGTDEIRSSVALTTAIDNAQNYTFTGRTALDFTGNGLANRITGTAGADSLVGGTGNDTYVIDNAHDVISETGADSGDTVQSTLSVDLNLAAFAGIEHVTLTGVAALTATGNAGANHLIGNDGANILDGRAGADTLE